ncbi:MAG: M15 family metallopeptidase [Cyclobacteriaceae bacterium]|nr:M15 family metallopeptidase [Cyclobacteriaceae bacterium]
MSLYLKTLVISLLALLSGSAFAQMNLFEPYDCRVHGDLSWDETVTDTLSQVAINAILNKAEPELKIEIDTIDGWKNWRTVDNYTYGKNRGSLPMITEVNALHPYFRDRILELIRTCRAKGIELAIVETYRTHAKQHEYQSMGKKYTRSGAGKSKHQYGLAIDVVPIVDSVAVWDNKMLWQRIGIVGEKLGLRWGGRWRHPYDPGHFEWTGGLATAELAAGKLPNLPVRDEHYPCIEEDIKLLRKYWREWETTQSSLTRK